MNVIPFIFLTISFLGLGGLLGYMEIHAESSWEFWAMMGLATLGSVGASLQGTK